MDEIVTNTNVWIKPANKSKYTCNIGAITGPKKLTSIRNDDNQPVNWYNNDIKMEPLKIFPKIRNDNEIKGAMVPNIFVGGQILPLI